MRRQVAMRHGFLSTYTGMIIAVNVVVFIVAILLMGSFGEDKVFSWIALKPSIIHEGGAIWTFITSMFMHGGFFHLFVNMISLMFIGNFVEKLIGKKRFLWLYFIGGIFAGLLFVVLAIILRPDSFVCPELIMNMKEIPSYCLYAVGASGAIFALGGILAVLTPRLPVLVFFVIPMPMWAAMGLLMFGLWALSLGMDIPIGNTAHLGGLMVGLGYGFYLRRKYPRKTKMISKYFAR